MVDFLLDDMNARWPDCISEQAQCAEVARGPATFGNGDRLGGPGEDAGVKVRGDVFARREDEVWVGGQRPGAEAGGSFSGP